MAEGNWKFYSDHNVIMKKDTKAVVAGCKTSRIPDEAESIGEKAFAEIDFDNTTVTILENIKDIGIGAFKNSNIKHLIIRGEKEIGSEAFKDCKKMERLDFYGDNINLGYEAFKHCTALSEMWCHDHKPLFKPIYYLNQIYNVFYNVGPYWLSNEGRCKIFAKYPEEFELSQDFDGNAYVNFWKYWFYNEFYPLPEEINSIYVANYTWPLVGEDADFIATSLTEHVTVSKVEYRSGTKIINPSPYSVGDTLDIAFTITLDEGYIFADDARLFVCGQQNDIFVKRSNTERVFIIQNCAVPVPPGGMPINSLSMSVEEPVEGQPLSTKVTSPTGRFYERGPWVIDSVVWKGGNLDSYDPDKMYLLCAYLHAKTDYRFAYSIDAKLNGRDATKEVGTNPDGTNTLMIFVAYGNQELKYIDQIRLELDGNLEAGEELPSKLKSTTYTDLETADFTVNYVKWYIVENMEDMLETNEPYDPTKDYILEVDFRADYNCIFDTYLIPWVNKEAFNCGPETINAEPHYFARFYFPAGTNIVGDVNGDGDVNTGDVTAVYSYIINGATSGFAKEAADVNGDGDVNTGDVTAIYNIIIGN